MTKSDKGKYACPYCSKVFGSYDELKEDILANHKGSELPLPYGHIRLNVNKNDHTIYVESHWTLYYVIHDKLGLTGCKQFCDRGACGSCTVIVDGLPMLSCMMLAIECDGKKIETAEGIANDKHPLIESYVKHHAMQCGYCTPGFVVTSKALLDKNKNPNAEEINEALAGNLCRCSTYPQHSIAVMEAAKKLGSDILKK